MSDQSSCTRRKFLGTTAAVATSSALGARRLRADALPRTPHIHIPTVTSRGDPDLAALGARALDAAMAAGATYADVRFTRWQDQRFYSTSLWREGDVRAVGIRVLTNGVWGFRSSTRWTPEEMARLAQGAVAQAKESAIGTTRVDLGPPPPVVHGSWTMPVKYDSFEVPAEEKMDVMGHFLNFIGTQMYAGVGGFPRMDFERQYKVFASSDGSTYDQTTYLSSADFGLSYRDQYSLGLPLGAALAPFLTVAGKGWEHVAESGLLEAYPQLVDEAEQTRHQVPVSIGRYDAVFSASAMAAIVDATIGTATELDRALGYEANERGTSYLNKPLDMLGVYRVGNPLLNVTANRSFVGGAATVRWDDEGVVPEDFTLVKDGVLVDFQTTREQASWIASYYQKNGTTFRSHGCARAPSAGFITMQHPPNLRLVPGDHDHDFDDLVAGVKQGIAVVSVSPQMDHQQLSGVGSPAAIRQIKNGKLGPYIANAGILFRTADFWKNLQAIGGSASERWFGFERVKGEPMQNVAHSVGAVPALVSNVGLIDVLRRA